MQSLFAIEHCLIQHIKSDGGMYPEVYMFEQEIVLSLMEKPVQAISTLYENTR